jgi:hypothetical protein
MCDFACVGKLTDYKPEGGYIGPDGYPAEFSSEARMGLFIPTQAGLLIAQEGEWVCHRPNGEFFAIPDTVLRAGLGDHSEFGFPGVSDCSLPILSGAPKL